MTEVNAKNLITETLNALDAVRKKEVLRIEEGYDGERGSYWSFSILPNGRVAVWRDGEEEITHSFPPEFSKLSLDSLDSIGDLIESSERHGHSGGVSDASSYASQLLKEKNALWY
jgi:hypothetical protein